MYQQHLYKQQLYNTLSNDQGLVDNVKLQLREKIINKLKTTTNQQGGKNVEPEKEFVRKVCLSLFSQFLNTERLFHTLAVFSPEAGLGKGILKVEELRQLLRVSPQDTGMSSLQQIITTYLPRSRLTSSTTSTSAQTDDKQTIQNLESKLANIQFQFKQRSIPFLQQNSIQSTQQRFLKYKNDMNKRYKEQLQQQIKRMRDFQIARVRLQQQEKCKLNMREYQQQLQISYQAKLEKLRQRQAEVMSRVAAKMKQVETYNYQMRQNVLKDFQMVKIKQTELEKLKEQVLEQQRRNVGGIK